MSVTSSQGMIHGLPVVHKIEQEALRHEQCIDEFLDLKHMVCRAGLHNSRVFLQCAETSHALCRAKISAFTEPLCALDGVWGSTMGF